MFSWFKRSRSGAGAQTGSRRRLCIPETLYRRMIGHCLEEKPLEACGLLVGAVDQVVAAYATDNEHRSAVIYKVDDHQLLQVFQELRVDRHEIIGIYHSHVRTAAVPSRTDIEQATWPEAYYVIVSLANQHPSVRAWRIVDHQVSEYPVVVVKGGPGQWRDLRRAVKARSEQEADSSLP